MWNAFGRLDSLLPDDEYRGKQFVADGEPLCLDPLFLQRATRKARNYFYLYLHTTLATARTTSLRCVCCLS